MPWSAVTVAGKPFLKLIEEQKERFAGVNLEEIAKRGRSAGWTILWGKGSTEFGIGASIAEVCRAILGDENRILPVSTYLDGEYGEHDVFASVPSRLNAGGVAEVIELNLTEDEQKKLDDSYSEAVRQNEELNLVRSLFSTVYQVGSENTCVDMWRSHPNLSPC